MNTLNLKKDPPESTDTQKAAKKTDDNKNKERPRFRYHKKPAIDAQSRDRQVRIGQELKTRMRKGVSQVQAVRRSLEATRKNPSRNIRNTEGTRTTNTRNNSYSDQSIKLEKKIERRNRVDLTGAVLMIGAAVLFDLLQAEIELIPVAGWILSVLFSAAVFCIFYFWTSAKGWGMSDTVKKVIVMWFLPAIEFIPILNILPAWTLSVVLQLTFLKLEDMAYNLSQGKIDAEALIEKNKKYIQSAYRERNQAV